MSCLLVFTSLRELKGANAGNRTRPNAHVIPPADNNCVGYDLEGKIYNLAALERKDAKPRFWVVSGERNYTYNPCRPFSQWTKTKETSDCFGDVAVCMATVKKGRYQLIGTQSSFHYDFNKETNTPQLVYTNKESFPNGQVIVDLKCDPSKKTPEEALFECISDTNNTWRFLVTSICSCPDGCPSDPEDPSSQTCPGGGVNKLEYIIPLGALSGIILVVPALYYRKGIRRCIRRRPAEEDDEERRPVIHGNDAEDYGARPEDLQNAPCPPGRSSGSNNPRDNINNELSRARHGNIERC
ncbi:hypothetical protein ABFA07_012768 [Porites harrisoni]